MRGSNRLTRGAGENVEDQTRHNALQLLKALYEHHVGERDEAEVLAVTIVPNHHDASAAGLEYGSRPYEQATRWLLDAEAIMQDEAFNTMYANDTASVPDYGLSFKITAMGLALLRG
jgi:hypothetical protein